MFACACGIDPATEAMVLQTLIAGGLAVPFILRDQIVARVRRWIGRELEHDACELSEGDAP